MVDFSVSIAESNSFFCFLSLIGSSLLSFIVLCNVVLNFSNCPHPLPCLLHRPLPNYTNFYFCLCRFFSLLKPSLSVHNVYKFYIILNDILTHNTLKILHITHLWFSKSLLNTANCACSEK